MESEPVFKSGPGPMKEQTSLPAPENTTVEDNFLSKNIRPMVLIFSWVLLAFVIITMLFKKEVNEIMLTTISYLVGLLTSGYFGLREYGKHHEKPKP